ncbi:MAG: tRNA adenosine(34) deaminase TadA [Myxococcota bacterium]
MSDETDVAWMRVAIEEAERARDSGEVPVGAVIVHEGRIVGRGRNMREANQDPTAHAEMIALRDAASTLGSWRLIDTTLFVTLEPCPMCAGALVNARVPRVVWGCDDPKAGATRTLYALGDDSRLNHRFESVPGVLGEACAKLLTDFFAAIRAKNGPRDSR